MSDVDPTQPRGLTGDRAQPRLYRRPEYLLNVAARNMSAFPDEPDHFLHWLGTRAEYEPVPDAELREQFVPRQVYGDYLRSIVGNHLAGDGHRPCVTTELITAEAVDVETGDGHCLVRMADGSAIAAEKIVLATGNEPPAPLQGTSALDDHPAWVANPWQQWEHRLPETGSVAHLGTGLSAVDAVLGNAVGIAAPSTRQRVGLTGPHGHGNSRRPRSHRRERSRRPVCVAAGPRPDAAGTYWETIAVPELRVQARRVAETLLGAVPVDVEEEGQLRLEYML